LAHARKPSPESLATTNVECSIGTRRREVDHEAAKKTLSDDEREDSDESE